MRIGEYELESPLMNAGGLVKEPADIAQMVRTGVAAVLAGSFTLESRVGNSPDGQTVYYHDEEKGITYNSLGMPNQGIAMVAKWLPHALETTHSYDKPLVLNVAPVSEKPAEEVIDMFGILADAGITHLDAVELNASCPNVVTGDGGRHELLSHHPEMLGDVLSELSDTAANKVAIDSLWVRVSPFPNSESAHEVASVVEAIGIDAISAFNTFPGGRPMKKNGQPGLEVPGNNGGMSGPGMTSQAEEQTTWLVDARSAINGSFDIVGSNGIFTARDVQRRLNLGASLVSATTLFWESRSWGEVVDRVLQDFSALAEK